MGAFERVARARGVETPETTRPTLRIVPTTDTEITAPAETIAHRPVRFSEIVGQPTLLMRLETHLRASVARGGQPGHILLDGGPGLGKTTIAQAVCGELDSLGLTSRFHEMTADVIRNPRKLAIELAKLADGDVLFIDEVHALKTSVQVALLRVLEDGVLFVEGDAKNPSVEFTVPPFTLVGATTHPGKLSNPLRDRFKFVGHLQPYTFDELQLVILSYAERLKIDMKFEAAQVIARASRYTPRRGIRLFEAVRDYAYEVTGELDSVIDEDTALQGLEYADIDQYGLEERDRRYLRVLITDFMGGPVGEVALSATLTMDVTELRNDVEPYLMIAGLLTRRSSGRCATKDTYTVLGLAVPPMINGGVR